MIIQTKFHGEIEIKEEQVIHFEKGLPGLEDEKKFVILSFNEEASIYILQSITNTSIAFFVTNPFEILANYEFELDQASIEDLEIDHSKDTNIEVIVIMTPQDPFSKTTVNLQAPVVINHLNKKAKQVILSDSSYMIKHPLFKETALGVKE